MRQQQGTTTKIYIMRCFVVLLLVVVVVSLNCQGSFWRDIHVGHRHPWWAQEDELPAPFAHTKEMFLRHAVKSRWAFHPTRAEESKPYTMATVKHSGASPL